MTNNNSGQGWVVTNIPFDLVSGIVRKITQRRIHTELYKGSVTTSCDRLEVRVCATIGCDECNDENEDSYDLTSLTYLHKSMSRERMDRSRQKRHRNYTVRKPLQLRRKVAGFVVS